MKYKKSLKLYGFKLFNLYPYLNKGVPKEICNSIISNKPLKVKFNF